MTSASRSTDNQELRNLLEDFLSGIRYRGIVDLELRKDRRDGRYKLLDFNPRVGAQFRLYRNASGIDVVQAMHLDLTGRKVPQSPGFRRRSFIVENYDLAVIWSYRRMHRLSLREWFRSLPGERELAWFSREDALPFLMMGIRTVYGVCFATEFGLQNLARAAASRNIASVARPRSYKREVTLTGSEHLQLAANST
jgi:predicted ATP-grasp superfamily ATP-dependent carboligase